MRFMVVNEYPQNRKHIIDAGSTYEAAKLTHEALGWEVVKVYKIQSELAGRFDFRERKEL